jgi:hypothetical protein
LQQNNLNIINHNAQNAGSPNHSIDIGQLPMRLVNQKGAQRKGGQAGGHGRNQTHATITGMVPHGAQGGPPGGTKNAWQSIDASSIQNEAAMNN